MDTHTISPTGEEQEWLVLEEQRESDIRAFYSLTACRPKFKDVPHPNSYRPDLPLSSELHGRRTKKWTLTTVDKLALGVSAPRSGKTSISLKTAHPDSYRPDLPLCGIGLSESRPTHKWTLAAAEKKLLAGRPLIYGKSRTERKGSQCVRDALRRAYIAQLGGRVQFDRETGKYNVTRNRTGKTRSAPWDAIVRGKYPDVRDFQQAAERWQSPNNERTRATH